MFSFSYYRFVRFFFLMQLRPFFGHYTETNFHNYIKKKTIFLDSQCWYLWNGFFFPFRVKFKVINGFNGHFLIFCHQFLGEDIHVERYNIIAYTTILYVTSFLNLERPQVFWLFSRKAVGLEWK